MNTAPPRLRIVYMGTPAFAVPSLEMLAQQHDVVAVVTAPDKPAGRGQKLSESAVKVAARALHIPVLQPEKLRDEAFIGTLQGLHADLFVVVAFRMLPDVVWQMPPLGTINLHGSLLPAYRGAAPIQRAVMNGETKTGLTTFFIEKEIDTGNVIDRAALAIGPDETSGELHDRMMVLGADLLARTVASIAHGTAHTIAQDMLGDGQSLPQAPKILRTDCRIDWCASAAAVHNQVRGLSPAPGAYTTLRDGKGQETAIYKMLRSAVPDTPPTDMKTPGTLYTARNKLWVACADGWLEILELQPQGKRKITAAEWLNGMRGAALPAFETI